MKDIEWVQVIVAFLLGVVLSATVKAMVSHLRGQASSAIG